MDINQPLCSSMRSYIEKWFKMFENQSETKGLGKTRIEFSNKSEDWAYDALKQWGNLFDERDSLINICSGKKTTPAIRDDLTNAFKIVKNALETFWKDRLESKKVDFYAPISMNFYVDF